MTTRRFSHARLFDRVELVRCADGRAWRFERPAPFVGPPTFVQWGMQITRAAYVGSLYDEYNRSLVQRWGRP